MTVSPKLCDKCGARAKCIDTRPSENLTYRRYACKCGNRWTTFEARREDMEIGEAEGVAE